MANRKTYTTKFKKRIALEAVKEHLTIAQITQKYKVHPSQIKKWKQILLEHSDILFEHGNRKNTALKSAEKEHDNLLRVIGKLQVENEFLKKTLLDFDNAAGASGQTWGARWSKGFKSDAGTIKLSAEAAMQSQYHGNGPASDVGYQAANIDFTRGKVTANLGFEVLEGSGGQGFVTPLATLHKFQGWADVFLGTPATGVRDIQFGFKSKVANFVKASTKPIALGITYHDFASDNGAFNLGHEIDAVINIPVSQTISVQTKLAVFNGATTGPADRTKMWVALNASF